MTLPDDLTEGLKSGKYKLFDPQVALEQIEILQLELENSAISLAIKAYDPENLEYTPQQLLTAVIGGYIITATKLKRALDGEILYGTENEERDN